MLTLCFKQITLQWDLSIAHQQTAIQIRNWKYLSPSYFIFIFFRWQNSWITHPVFVQYQCHSDLCREQKKRNLSGNYMHIRMQYVILSYRSVFLVSEYCVWINTGIRSVLKLWWDWPIVMYVARHYSKETCEYPRSYTGQYWCFF